VTAGIVGLRYYNSIFLVAGSWTISYHVSIRCVTKKIVEFFQKLMNPTKCFYRYVLHATYYNLLYVSALSGPLSRKYKIQEVCKTGV